MVLDIDSKRDDDYLLAHTGTVFATRIDIRQSGQGVMKCKRWRGTAFESSMMGMLVTAPRCIHMWTSMTNDRLRPLLYFNLDALHPSNVTRAAW